MIMSKKPEARLSGVLCDNKPTLGVGTHVGGDFGTDFCFCFWGEIIELFCKYIARILSHIALIMARDDCTITGSEICFPHVPKFVKVSCDSGTYPKVG